MIDNATRLRALRYAIVRRLADLRYGRQRPRGQMQTPGRITAHQKHERGITITCARGAIRLTAIAPDCIQVRFQPGGKFDVPFSYAVAKVTWPAVPFTVDESDDAITLETAELSCKVNRSDGRLSFVNAGGQVIAQDAEPIRFREGEFQVTRNLPAAEGCYGLAAQPVGLDLRGRRYILWNTDPIGTARGKIPTYYTIPFYLGVQERFAHGLFWDNPGRGWVDVGAARRDRLTVCGEVGELRYYQFGGPNAAAVLARYTELTGRMPLPPAWALGLHLSRWSYTPADRVREVAGEMRSHRIPCDAVYLDIDYMDGFRCFTWHPRDFPAPGVLISDLARQGFKTVTILDPGIKVDAKYPVYQSGMQEDVFIKYPSGRPFVGPCWPGDAVYPDFTSPKARAWWAAQFEPLLSAGVAGIWNDMNEPVIFSPGPAKDMPDAVRHDYEGQQVNHVAARNVYGMLMARASREALEKARPNKRPFNMVRAAHAGAQRYASTWTGDNRSDWDHLRLGLTMTLNSGLSGMAFNGPDVGGFFGTPEPELYARWIELGAFLPYFRIHTAKDTPSQEPWAFGQPIEDIARTYIALRYQLLPYLYSAFAQCAQYGLPIARPMFMADPADGALRGIEDAFMLGDSLLVAPILERGQTEREVYLPRGRWFDYHTGHVHDGGRLLKVAAPLETLPLFVRAGHVIPMWPLQQYVGQKPIDELRLKVYYGEGEVTLYEDEGEGAEYLNGLYRWLYFTCKPSSDGGLGVAWRRAGKYQPTYERIRCEVYGLEREPKIVELDGAVAPLWYYEKGVVEFTANRPFENARIVPSDAPSAEDTLHRSPLKDRE